MGTQTSSCVGLTPSSVTSPSPTPEEGRMVHVLFPPTALAPSLPPRALQEAREPQVVSTRRAPSRRPEGQTWAREWAAPRPRRWSLGRVRGLAACRAVPTSGAPPLLCHVMQPQEQLKVQTRGPATSSRFAQPQLCPRTSWGLRFLGRGAGDTHTRKRAELPASPLIRGHEAGMLRQAGTPGKYRSATLGDRH